MFSLKRLVPSVVILAGAYATGSLHAEEIDPKKALEELRAIRAQNDDLQKQINNYKTGSVKKASAEVAVDKALKKSTDDGFYHDCDLHPRKIKIGGLVDFSFQYNINQPGERFNSLRAFDNYQSNDFALNLANVYFDGTAKQKGEAGFMIDLGFGRDANTAYGLGYDNVLQAYINYIAPIGKGLELTAGKFYTPIGFEVAKGDNWNITRSMNFAWTQPLSHTGGQLGYNILDSWSIKGGVVNSFFNRTAQDNNDDKTFYISNTWKPLKNLSWTVNGMIGNEETRQSSVAGLYNGSATTASNVFGANTVPFGPGTTPIGTLFGSSPFSPAVASPYGDVNPPIYTTAYGTPSGLRGNSGSNTFTVNSVITYDPMETLHFGFESNWQMKQGYDYKADDLNSDLTAVVGFSSIPSNSSLGSQLAPSTFTGNLLQQQAVWDYYHGNRSDATTWGAAGYVKWDFQKNWYVALRGEYISDQDNLNFRNDAGVIAQGNYLTAAKLALFPNISYNNPVGGLGFNPGNNNVYDPATGDGLSPIYGPITPAQYSEMIKKLDHRNNDAWSVTGTVGWNITKSLKWKLEYRHDQASKDVFYAKGSHQVNALPPSLPFSSTATPANGSNLSSGYVPSTTDHQDTVSMQFQYSF